MRHRYFLLWFLVMIGVSGFSMLSAQASDSFQISRRHPVQELRPVQGKIKKRYAAVGRFC